MNNTLVACMKKIVSLFLVLELALTGCGKEERVIHINFPFGVEDIENIEMYHYVDVPSSPEKKVVTKEEDIKTLYDKFVGLSLEVNETETTTGAEVTSFRFNLSDNTDYEIVYVGYGVKNGELQSTTGNFKYFTSADIGWNWFYLNDEYEAITVEESELPQILDGTTLSDQYPLNIDVTIEETD